MTSDSKLDVDQIVFLIVLVVKNLIIWYNKENNLFVYLFMTSDAKPDVDQIVLFLIGKNRRGIGKRVAIFFIGNGAEIRPLEKGRKSPVCLPLPSLVQQVQLCSPCP